MILKRFSTLTLAISALLVSCVSNPDNYDPDYVISFNPAVKAIETDPSSSATYPTGSSFAVWAYKLPEGKSWSGNESQATAWLQNAPVSYSGGVWKTSDSKHWGLTGEQFTFFAYSPSSAAASFDIANGIRLSGYNTLTDNVDFLYSDPIADLEKNVVSGHVSVPFKHALSKVEVRIKTSTSNINFVVKSVKIEDVYYKGDFRSVPAGWDLTEDCTDLEFCTKEVPLTYKETALATFNVLAQSDVRPVTIIYDTYVNGVKTEADIDVSAAPIIAKWAVGRKYVYTIELNTDSVTYKTDILD